MTIREVAGILNAKWICCEEEADTEIRYAFASDMMSDVLAHVCEDTMLLTGLINSQSVRTAEMLDVPCLVFVRGKKPSDDILEMAEENEITVMSTSSGMYVSSGILYSNGLNAIKRGI